MENHDFENSRSLAIYGFLYQSHDVPIRQVACAEIILIGKCYSRPIGFSVKIVIEKRGRHNCPASLK